MIGTHTVMAYSDPNAAGWGNPLFTNSFFAVDIAGWRAEPFSVPWTWAYGGQARATMTSANGGMLQRTPAAVIARPPAASVDTWRVRVKVTSEQECRVWATLNFGKTADDAAVGAFWAPAGAVKEIWAAQGAGAGTSSLEFSWLSSWYPIGPEYGFLGVQIRVDLPGAYTVPWVVSLDSVEVQYRSTGASADISCLIDELSIIHGRDDTTGQPNAAAATIDFTTTPTAPLPAWMDIGSVIIVTSRLADAGGTQSTRFTGKVTDLSLAWDDAGTETPDAGVGQITAVATLAELGRRVVGDEPWTQELDGARVTRIASLAAIPLDPAWSDPGTVQINPRDVDAQPALDLMQSVANSAGGVVWQTRAGDIRYADSEHRRGAAPSLVLDSCDVLVTPRWSRNLAGLVNDLSIGYGVAPEGGEQPRYSASDAASMTKYGRYEYSVTTELAALADATALGNLLLVRNSSPVWVLSAMPLDLKGLSDTETAQLLGLEMHDLIQVTGMPAIGAAPTAANMWVEGWHERLAYGVHEMELAVSGFCRTTPPPRWDDVPPGTTWDTMNQAMTWNDAVCMGPIPDTKTWDSTPATTRWDSVPASVTWDTY
jgi:hypothetical protein